MRTFKFLSIFVFLAVFINSRANTFILGFESKKTTSSKEIKIDQKISASDPEEDSPHKRKRKPRGIEVDVPQISDSSFEQPFVYRAFKSFRIEETYASFLYCVDRKRGPPLN